MGSDRAELSTVTRFVMLGLPGSCFSGQWHPFSCFFFVAAPLKIVFPKKGSLFFLQGHW